MVFLSPEFLSKYDGVKPRNAGVLFNLIKLRYLRWLPDKKRRETWLESCQRVTEYSLSLYSKDGPASKKELVLEAEQMFDKLFNLESFPAGRSMAMGGSEASRKYPENQFNCAYTNIEEIEDICDLFHLSLCNCGVGFGILDEMVNNLPICTSNFELEHHPYNTKYPIEKEERTSLSSREYGWDLVIGDSKEGWVSSLRILLDILCTNVNPNKFTIKIIYDYIRPEGERLSVWGGRAAGPDGLKNMFSKLEKTIKRNNGNLEGIDCLDINTSIGKNVVSGGNRRAALIALFSKDNKAVEEAKNGDSLGWYIETNSGNKLNWDRYLEDTDGSQFQEDFYNGIIDWMPNPETDHRTMSNNSMVFYTKPSKEELKVIFDSIKSKGEPGFYNLEAAKKRRPNCDGLNPCGEILLSSKGVCNLSTVNLVAHLNEGNEIDWTKLESSIRNATRIGCRQTNVTLTLPKWDYVQKRDRLVGVSKTGDMDFLDRLGWSSNSDEYKDLLKWMNEIANDESNTYASEMRIPRPLLTTAIKPEGSLSLLPTVSCGIHRSHAPYYIRRSKFASYDPVCKALIDLGVPHENDKTKKDSNRMVFCFPIKSNTKIEAYDESFKDQFYRYLNNQTLYTDHNTSTTLYVGKDEWKDALDLVYENWDNVIAIAFLPKKKGTYIQAPYESISKDKYELMMKSFPNLDSLSELVDYYELQTEYEEYEILEEACTTGACPII